MRDIKFRAKNKINGNWVYGFFVHEGIQKIHSGHAIYPIDTRTVGQFTGLKDKTLKIDIYEGDINEHGQVIKWNQLHNCFGWFDEKGFVSEILSDVHDSKGKLTYYHLSCYIIGNIHDNPELLK